MLFSGRRVLHTGMDYVAPHCCEAHQPIECLPLTRTDMLNNIQCHVHFYDDLCRSPRSESPTVEQPDFAYRDFPCHALTQLIFPRPACGIERDRRNASVLTSATLIELSSVAGPGSDLERGCGGNSVRTILCLAQHRITTICC